MKTPLAIHNLWHQGVKTLVSVAGVAFSLLLVFMQLGFMGAVSSTATNVLESLDFDILIRAQDYVHLYEPSTVERRWLVEANNIESVADVQPFWIMIHNWRKLPTSAQQGGDFTSQFLPIAILAAEPGVAVFQLPDVQEAAAEGRLSTAQDVLLDDSTQVDYGPLDGRRFGNADIGRMTEVGGQAFEVQGTFKLGTGLAANGAAIVAPSGFARIAPWDINTTCSLGLLRLRNREPADVDAVVEQLRSRLITDAQISRGAMNPVAILSRENAMNAEKRRWLWQTPIGLIFQLGVLLSLLVGAAIVYMVLSTDVANRLPEYATLLAIGYSRKYLAGIVMTQAMVLNTLGFFTAWAAAEGLYRITYALSNIPMTMTPLRVVVVLVLGFAMCCGSGLLALRKLWKAEPASLF